MEPKGRKIKMSPINLVYWVVTKEGGSNINNISVNSTCLQGLQIRWFCFDSNGSTGWKNIIEHKLKINSQMHRHSRGMKSQYIFFTGKYF